MAFASASDKNQCALRRSFRSRPLKDSTKALSVGLPGRREVQGHVVGIGPAIERLRDELGPIVHLDSAGRPAQGRKSRHHRDNLFALDAFVDFDRQRLTSVSVDNRQSSKPPAVEQRVGDKFHRPQLVRPGRRWLPFPVGGADVTPRALIRKLRPSSRYNR